SVTSSDGRVLTVSTAGLPVFELTDARRARFRSNPSASRWIGFGSNLVDLTWAANELGAVANVHVDTLEVGERFHLVVSGDKPQLPGTRFATDVEGTLDAAGRVRFTISSTLDLGPGLARTKIEMLDLWYERIFWPASYRGTPELYREFVYGFSNGVVRAPKLHVYTDSSTPEYPANTLIQPLVEGGFFAALDSEDGGVRVRFDSVSTPGNVGVCWWTWDSHLFLYSDVPTTHFAYRVTVDDLDANEAKQLSAAASEIDFENDEA